MTIIYIHLLVSFFLGRPKIFSRMKVTTFLMAKMTIISSRAVSTGPARCSSFSPASGTRWGCQTFGGFPTSCSKAVEVGRRKYLNDIIIWRFNHQLALIRHFLTQHLVNWLKLKPFYFLPGVFLLPYFITLFVCAIPMLFMELSVGQFTGRGVIGAIGQCCPLLKGLLKNVNAEIWDLTRF